MNDGKHRGGYKYRNKRNGNSKSGNSVIGTIVSAITGIIIKDLANEDSRLKMLFSKIIHPQRIKKDSKNKIIKGEFEIIENKKKEKL